MRALKIEANESTQTVKTLWLIFLQPAQLFDACEQLFGGAEPAFDGAVHIPLPGFACVFAGEEHAFPRQRKHASRGRWKRSVKERVPTARPRIVFPSYAT